MAWRTQCENVQTSVACIHTLIARLSLDKGEHVRPTALSRLRGSCILQSHLDAQK